MVRSGALARRWLSLSSVRPRSERFRTQMLYSSVPARAWMKDDLPEPGGPWRRYPRRYGIPAKRKKVVSSQPDVK